MKKILPIIFIFIAVGAVGFFLLGYAGPKEFTGSITEVLARGKEATCTWENGAGTSGKVYIQNAGSFLMALNDGLGYILVTGGCLYSWVDGGDPGAKQCFTSGEDFTQMMIALGLAPIYEGVEYRCQQEGQDGTRFIVPTEVEFTDWD